MPDEGVDILLVEDSPDDAALFTRVLKSAGLTARLRLATDGKEALDYFFGDETHAGRSTAHRPKVIILDLKLPRVDGLEVLRRLRVDPRTRTIPVVVLSSSQEGRDLAESYALGVNSYVVKPVNFTRFSELIRLLGEYWLHCNQLPNPGPPP